jgi:Concanavalin A-like lectin/glucanases superfamily/Regulator of chromosome condensation (RCC1) repeat
VGIAAGDRHSLALSSDETIVGWGSDTLGQATAPADLGSFVAITAGGFHSLALRTDGTVAAWGDDGFGQTDVPLDLSNVVAISAGEKHSLALRNDGSVVAWGDSTYSQTNTPAGLGGLVAIAAGAEHNLVLTPRLTPTAVTLPVTDVTTNSARFSAIVNPQGGETTVYYEWGTNSNYGNITGAADLGGSSAPQSFSTLLTGLPTDTVLHCQVVASNVMGSVTGGDVSFMVGPPAVLTPPQVPTLYAGHTTLLSVNPQGGGEFSYHWVFNGEPIPDATNSTYNLSQVQFTDAGDYACVISSPYGSTISSNSLTVIPLPTAGYAAVVVADHPMAYWRLGETNETVAHDFWGGHDGRYHNVTLGAAGFNPSDADRAVQIGPSLRSVVSDIQGIDFSSASNTVAFSVECWVYAIGQSSTHTPVILTKGTAYPDQFSLLTDARHFYYWHVRDTSNNIGEAISPVEPHNTWQHLVGVYDGRGGQVRLYINGALVASVLAPPHGVVTTPGPVSIGSQKSDDPGPYNENFHGRIDEVAIYDYALSANQILAHYVTGTSLSPVTLSVQATGNQVQLVWPGGTLQSAGQAAGPYQDLANAISPYVVAPLAVQEFYRVKVK